MSKPSSIYIRRATRAQKLGVKLDVAQDRALLWAECVGVSILDKGTGTFTLTFIFPDGTEMELTSDELTDGDLFEYDIKELRVTNTSQPNQLFKVIVDQQILQD